MKRYNPKDIEPKWQKIWADSKLYEVSEASDKPKNYTTAMFPYPSGAGLHVGHVRNYSITDAIARFHRQKGQNVLTTIGWDGFGLPAENYAIKTGTPPAVSTAANVANFKSQLLRLGMSYDWSRELNTTDPSYYRWTQWLFLQLFNKGLAYQKESLQWWCPHDKTVLANEQVESGKCWRCGNEVVKKSMRQWFFKITDYADELLEGLDELAWPDKIKTMQCNWIGRSEGAEIDFAVDGSGEIIKVFTTRPDTIYGATFMVLAPEHTLVKQIATKSQNAKVQSYIKDAQAKSDIERQETDREKTGVFTGAYAINPATGGKIPVWVADYVLYGYGTGAIMAVPAHDERDRAFADKFNLTITPVVAPTFGAEQPNEVHKKATIVAVRNPKTNEVIVLNWGPRQANYGGNLLIGGTMHDGESAETTARREIAEETGYTKLRLVKQSDMPGFGHFYSNVKGHNVFVETTGLYFELEDDTRERTQLDDGEVDKFTVEWHDATKVADLMDDGIHQYYAREFLNGEIMSGEGILFNSGQYNALTSAEARERIVADLEKQGVAKAVTNYRMRDWLISRQRYWGVPIPIIHCDKDGAVAVPDDQLPLLLPEVEQYEPDGSGRGVLARSIDWVNVSCPKCGGPARRETDTMDGYVDSSWYIFRYTDAHNDKQPWDPAKVNYWSPLDFYCGGDHAVAHLLYVRFWTRFFRDQGMLDFSEPVKRLVYNGYINAPDGHKMSKSRGNVVDPLELIDAGYGADALRVYELFIGPYELDAAWDPNGIAGTYRFLNRVWNLVQEHLESDKSALVPLAAVHQAIKKVTQDLERLSFNTAIAAQMELVNELYKAKSGGMAGDDWRSALTSLVQLVAPFAPHIADDLWQQLGHDGSVHTASWPVWDDKYLVTDTMQIVVQVDGKVRAKISLPADASEADVTKAALAESNVREFVGDKKPARTIYVPGRLLNVVVK